MNMHHNLTQRRKIEEKNPLKQGLKHATALTAFRAAMIEEKNPLKQGLKQAYTKEDEDGKERLKRRIH